MRYVKFIEAWSMRYGQRRRLRYAFPIVPDSIYRGRVFDAEIIELCVARTKSTLYIDSR
jgi:hypothetical protein